MSTKHTPLTDLGEFKLIHHLTKDFSSNHPHTHLGIGDDAAVIDTEGENYTLISTDMLVEGVHFDLAYTPLKHLGYKMVTVNVSDIIAMNGTAQHITISMAVSNRFSVEALEELYIGIRLACQDYNLDLIGGDTTSSIKGLTVSITAVGTVAKNKLCKRSGAQPNDLVCVTGNLGGAYVGLQILRREKEVFLVNPSMQPVLDEHSHLIARQLKPAIQHALIKELDQLALTPTAMIDISDGLSSEIFHISQASKVGITVYEDKLPIDRITYETALSMSLDPVTCALNGGEDYELLFTIDQKDFSQIENHTAISVIGFVTPEVTQRHLITKANNTLPLEAQGWVHYS